jgi:hypothetical protein
LRRRAARLDPDALRAALLPKIRQVVPIDALWWATVDPATLLFTSAHRDNLPEAIGPYFVENELLADDANKWTDLARSRDGVRTLVEPTGGELERSARYREIFRPLGLSDELRVVLRTRDTCWATCASTARGRMTAPRSRRTDQPTAGSTSYATRRTIDCSRSRSTRSRPSCAAQPTRVLPRPASGCGREPAAGS